MVIITKTKQIEFYENETKAKEPLLLWYNIAKQSDWQGFSQHKNKPLIVLIVSGMTRCVFNIGGNKYWIAALIHLAKESCT